MLCGVPEYLAHFKVHRPMPRAHLVPCRLAPIAQLDEQRSSKPAGRTFNLGAFAIPCCMEHWISGTPNQVIQVQRIVL